MRLVIVVIVQLACHLAGAQRYTQDGGRKQDGVIFADDSSVRNLGGLGRLRKVYEWKQITYNIEGRPLLQDRFGETEDETGPSSEGDRLRVERQIQEVDVQTRGQYGQNRGRNGHSLGDSNRRQDREERYGSHRRAPSGAGDKVVFEDNAAGADSNFQTSIPDSQKYFIQYNNVPMGVERWRNKLFITMPRRRYGIPSTLNYLDLNVDKSRSPGLRPYPSARAGRRLVSVYRTRVDECDRMWAVDTGLLEIPDARQQVQPPAIVIFDLHTDRQIHRYELKASDIVDNRTSAGLASITVDVDPGQCGSAHAYIADLATYGMIVYSLKENDSWRVNHNYFSFSPIAGKLNIAGQQFSWNDGIFSIALGERQADGYRKAYFHPMVSFQEFSVSTRVLRNRTLATRGFHGDDFVVEGERGAGSQSTAHGLHGGTGALLYAEVGRDALGCWNVKRPLALENKATLAQDHAELVYPSDLHVTGDEVWLMSNTMPRFIYSRLDTDQYNFRIFRANVYELIAGTVCEPPGGGGAHSADRPTYSG